MIYFLFPLSWKFSTYFRLNSISQIRLATSKVFNSHTWLVTTLCGQHTFRMMVTFVTCLHSFHKLIFFIGSDISFLVCNWALSIKCVCVCVCVCIQVSKNHFNWPLTAKLTLTIGWLYITVLYNFRTDVNRKMWLVLQGYTSQPTVLSK